LTAIYVVYVNPRCENIQNSPTKRKSKECIGKKKYARYKSYAEKKADEIEKGTVKKVQVRIPNIDGIVYNDRQMKDFLKISST
jgi:hypothetical protein